MRPGALRRPARMRRVATTAVIAVAIRTEDRTATDSSPAAENRKKVAPASKIVRRLPGLVCLATMVSCLAPQQASVAETDQYGWNRSERVAVSFENTDTASLRTMDVVVRYGSNFSYDRLVLP